MTVVDHLELLVLLIIVNHQIVQQQVNAFTDKSVPQTLTAKCAFVSNTQFKCVT